MNFLDEDCFDDDENTNTGEILNKMVDIPN